MPKEIPSDDRPFITASGLFRGLAENDVEAILERASVRAFRRKEMLFLQGEPVDGLYLLISGRVKLAQLGGNGQQTVIRFLGPGELFAAVAALERAPGFPVGAQALSDARVVFWPRPEIQEIFRSHQQLAANLMQEVAERAREFQTRLREVATERVPMRLARMLLRLAEQAGCELEGDLPENRAVLIDFPLTRQDLAEMTGTTLYTVSRLLSEWAEKGLLEIGRGRVVLLAKSELLATVEASEGG